MMSLRLPVLRIAVFSTFLLLGLWMARSIHDPFQHSGPVQPNFLITSAPAEQQRLLLIVVDKINGDQTLQTAWWVSSQVDIPTTMVSVYPSITQQAFRDAEISSTFSLTGIWGWRKPNEKFFELLREWDIHWNDYLVIDLAVQSAIIDQLGGVTINGMPLSGKEANQQAAKISTLTEQLSYQSSLWSTICSRSSQQIEGLDLSSLPLNLNNHTLTSLGSVEDTIELFPARPTFPVCMVNSGLMKPAMPPFLPTK